MTSVHKGDEEEPIVQDVDASQQRVTVDSTFFGEDASKIGAAIGVGRNHSIDPDHVRNWVTQDQLKDQQIRNMRKWMSVAAVFILLLIGSNFAVAWLAVSLQKQVETDDNSNVIKNANTGDEAAILPHNSRTDILERAELGGLVVSASDVENKWSLYLAGNLGTVQIQFEKNDGTDITLALVGTDSVTRHQEDGSDSLTYGPFHVEGKEGTEYEVICDATSSTGKEFCGVFKLVPDGNSVRVEELNCFSTRSTVELQDGTIKTMKDLKIGDMILVAPDKYQPVVSFGHRTVTVLSDFYSIGLERSTRSNKREIIELSEDHLIFKHGEALPVPASLLKVGDALVGKNGEAFAIQSIKRIQSVGAHNAFTQDGTVVVGGVLASNHISFGQPSAHVHLGKFDTGMSWHFVQSLFIKPYIFYCTHLTRLNVFAANDTAYCSNESYDENGLNPVTGPGIDMVTFVLNDTIGGGVVLQVMMMIIIVLVNVVVAAVCWLLEEHGVILLGILMVYSLWKMIPWGLNVKTSSPEVESKTHGAHSKKKKQE